MDEKREISIFYQEPYSHDRPMVHLWFNTTQKKSNWIPVQAMFDSGAFTSFMGKNTAALLGIRKNMIQKGETVPFKTANGELLNGYRHSIALALGDLESKKVIRDKVILLQVLISPKAVPSVLLGRDFLKKVGVLLDNQKTAFFHLKMQGNGCSQAIGKQANR